VSAGRRFRVGYLSYVPHRSFLDTAAAQPALEVVRIPLDRPEEAVVSALAECDAYYCMASRDELPKPFHVQAALLARLPKLLMVGSTAYVEAAQACGPHLVAGGDDPERGDVPGWVMITVMTAALVLAILVPFREAIVSAVQNALASVTNGG